MPPPVFPVFIDDTPVTTSYLQGNIFEVGSNLYAIASADLSPGDLIKLLAWKSTDKGLTWAEMDAAGRPQIGITSGSNFQSVLAVTKIVVINVNGGLTGQLAVKFDTATDTWGAPITSVDPDIGTNNNVPSPIYRPAFDDIVVGLSSVDGFTTPDGFSRCGFFIFDNAADTFGAVVACGETDPSVDVGYVLCGIAQGLGTSINFILATTDQLAPPYSATVSQQPMTGLVLGAVQVLDTQAVTTPINQDNVKGVGDGTTIDIVWVPDTGGDFHLLSSPAGDTLTPVLSSVTDPAGSSSSTNFTICPGFFFITTLAGAPFELYVSTRTGSSFSQPVLQGSYSVSLFLPEYTATTLTNGNLWGLLMFGNTGFLAFWSGFQAPVVVTVPRQASGGATYFPRYINKTLLLASVYRNLAPVVYGPYPAGYGLPAPLSAFWVFPNGFDLCLSRDFRLFERIDPLALACGRKPHCTGPGSGEREWVERPANSIILDRNGAIPLPAPTDGDTTVFSFRVPIGYDGVLIGHYQSFTQPFVEGSGDLLWRVSADGRYLSDMGTMPFSIGSSITVSPIPGGLFVKSGNLVQYIVSAPNTGGSLPIPGVGNVLAGLYGFFYPRK